jgi:L,D-transpeptidase ErfK/SrfK
MGRRRQRVALVATIAVLLGMVTHARGARWTEEDFAHRTPVPYTYAARGSGEQTVTGALNTYTIEPGDTLLDIARHFDLGYNEIVAANPGVDAWLPPVGEVLVIPTEFILPEGATQGLVVNIPEMRLYYFNGGTFTTYPVGLGRDDWRTPTGSFKVRGKTENPTWVIPESIREEHIRERGDPRTSIPGGDPDNPLGPYRLELTLPLYMLHGTNVPWGVGMQVSHGCIRFYNEDITVLFHDVRVGTPGEFLYQPVKVGIRDGIKYIEVHPDIYGLRSDLEQEADALLGRHGWQQDIDHERVRKALREQSGLPVVISRENLLQADAH